ncbi:MAG TPA: hypothetical protein DCS97_07225, partial [Planctomycetes bacterium]|nr:hypothetical protein [Planctomycetota bacterium]
MSCLRATILLLGLFGLSAGAGAVEGLVLSRSGPAVSGGITVAATGPTCADSQLAWDGVAVASFATPVAGSLDQGVLLANGELLRGVPRAVGSSGLSFAGDLHGLRELPLPSLAVIVLGAVRSQQLDGLAGGETGAVLVNGDRLAGQMAFLNDEAVGIDTGRRVAQVPRARVAAVILRPVVHPPSGLWLLLSGGDRLLVTSLAPVVGGIAVQ